MAGGVPDRCLDGILVDGERAGLELDADGGLGIDAELVASELGEQLCLPHRRVIDQHHLEDVVNLLVELAVVIPTARRHPPSASPSTDRHKIDQSIE